METTIEFLDGNSETVGKPLPYIGVTGISSADEMNRVISAFEAKHVSPGKGHFPMVGVLVSYKTLNGQLTLNRRYPLLEDVPEILEQVNGRAFPTIHYNTKELGTLSQQISQVFSGFTGIYATGLCRAVQLNVNDPPGEQIYLIKDEFPEMQVIIQANSHTLNGKAPSEAARDLMQYENLADYILIDPSGGKGKAFDIGYSVELFWCLESAMPHVTIGFAGGLGPSNAAWTINELVGKLGHEGFSIDAEGALRDKLSEEYGDDLLNIDKVWGYIGESAKVLAKHKNI